MAVFCVAAHGGTDSPDQKMSPFFVFVRRFLFSTEAAAVALRRIHPIHGFFDFLSGRRSGVVETDLLLFSA